MTNADWLYKHPKELAELLIQFDARFDLWIAPDRKTFGGYYDKNKPYSIAQAEEHCLRYIVKWLKQEHKNKED